VKKRPGARGLTLELVEADFMSDFYAQKRNILSGIETRLKMVFIAAALILNISSPGVIVPLCFLIFSLATLLAIRIPFRVLLHRLTAPLLISAFILLTQVFFVGRTPMFHIDLMGLSLTGYIEGLKQGVLILCRVLGGVSLILLLSMSTPADRLFRASAWFRVPAIFMEIALLMYRYIFVLSEEMVIMQSAQRVRLGYRSWRQSMISLSSLAAGVILRAYDRAERIFAAMTVRGYAGLHLNQQLEFGWKDGLTATFMVLILAGFYLMGQATI
jgi:cobalt/nickel transport system permease protein